METRDINKFFFLQVKAPKEIHAILTKTLACFLPGRAKDLSAPLYLGKKIDKYSYGCSRGWVKDSLKTFLAKSNISQKIS